MDMNIWYKKKAAIPGDIPKAAWELQFEQYCRMGKGEHQLFFEKDSSLLDYWKSVSL